MERRSVAQPIHLNFKLWTMRTPQNSHKNQGITIVEIIITLVIVSLLYSIGGPTLTSLIKKKKLQRATDQLVTHLVEMRGRAATTLNTQRLKLENATQYSFEEFDGTAWVAVGSQKSLPSDIEFRTFDVTNKATSLEMQSNGLPNFNGADPSPFVTVIEMPVGTSRKGIFIGTGGDISSGDGADDVL